ncbi:hypothetical protein [Marinoscillum luteum]|uniref:DUF4625 domain-containing protein n=1 Tax=Marinoscillum luteum TaxID=861051 RepID=A0ABW7NCW0_9BACT
MKNKWIMATLTAIVTFLCACEKDEGILPEISFKTATNYVSTDATLPAGTDVVIGITASKTEDKDVLKKFNISKSVDGGTASTVYTQDLSGSDGDNFEYDYSAKVEGLSGQTSTFTFTVTNRDGLVNQVALTLTVE